MLLLLAIITITASPHDSAIREHFDQIEVNHFWSETTCDTDPLQYRLTFCQVLFRRWHPETGEHEIEAWRMLKPFAIEDRLEGLPSEISQPLRQRTNMFPEWNHTTKRYSMRWLDNDVLRIVTADSVIVTNTLFDAEIVERERYGKEKRAELRKR